MYRLNVSPDSASLPYFGMQLQGDFSAEVAHFFCHSSSSDFFNGKAKIPESKRESYYQSQRRSGVKQRRYQQSGYATRMAAAIRDIINSTQGIATLLPKALYLALSDAPGMSVQPSG